MIWERVAGSKIYEISSKGSVRNIKTGTVAKHSIGTNGRHRVTLYEDGVRKSFFVDELMADAFFTGERYGRKILHIDGDPHNLDLMNLHAYREPRKRIIEVGSGRIFNSQVECCRAMNVPSGALSRCLSGKSKSYKGLRFEEID